MNATMKASKKYQLKNFNKYVSTQSNQWFNDIMDNSLGFSERRAANITGLHFKVQSLFDNLDDLPYKDEQGTRFLNFQVESHIEAVLSNKTNHVRKM
ncbi:hypothetical protein ACH5RR_006724 [Cinchona calisaya]|uniref:Uncharacterized protein n=1 Tax=Cinchona calisaya TaxID=153742 RepID=A0ABD3APV3_9GENT